jgi:hypothetical protein
MIRFALIFLAFPAHAETWQPMMNGSSVTLRPTEQIGASHELFFNNSGGDGAERLAYGATIGPHTMEVTLGAPEADTIRVTPGEGYIAVPEELTLPDGSSSVIVIYDLDSVGM